MICIIDTNVFCNLLRVPGRNQKYSQAKQEFEAYIQEGASFLLPMATIIETGNHIAQNGDGRQRRAAAQKFVQQLQKAFADEAPWKPTPIQSSEEILIWLDEFVEKATQATGFGDLSILKLYDKQCRLHPSRRVLIWSYDRHLLGFDRPPTI